MWGLISTGATESLLFKMAEIVENIPIGVISIPWKWLLMCFYYTCWISPVMISRYSNRAGEMDIFIRGMHVKFTFATTSPKFVMWSLPVPRYCKAAPQESSSALSSCLRACSYFQWVIVVAALQKIKMKKYTAYTLVRHFLLSAKNNCQRSVAARHSRLQRYRMLPFDVRRINTFLKRRASRG